MLLNALRNRPLLIVIALVMISIIPLLSPAVPPITDVLGHIGRYRVQLDVGHDPILQRYYGFEWALIGNLGVDLLVQLLGPILGLEPAVKLIVIGVVALTVTGFLMVARQVHGRIGPAALFALPLVYGFPFQFGFINYCLSMGMAFLAFALWLRLGQQGRIGLRTALFIPIAFCVWTAHISGLGALGLFVFASEFVRLRDAGLNPFAALFKGGINCLPLALPLLITIFSGASDTEGGTGDWFRWDIKYQWITRALNDQWQQFDVFSVMILVLLIAVTAILSDLRFNRTLGLAAGLLFIAFIITPRILIGSAYADMRLAPFVLAMALLAIETTPQANRRVGRVLMLAGLGFFCVRTLATTESFRRYDAVLTREAAALNFIPVGARVATFVHRSCDEEWMLERRSHLPSLALARRKAFTNDQFVLGGAQLLRIRYAPAAPFDRDPSQFVTGEKCTRRDWRSFGQAMTTVPRGAFDYLWVIGAPEDREVDYSGLTPAWRNGASVLYRIDR